MEFYQCIAGTYIYKTEQILIDNNNSININPNTFNTIEKIIFQFDENILPENQIIITIDLHTSSAILLKFNNKDIIIKKNLIILELSKFANCVYDNLLDGLPNFCNNVINIKINCDNIYKIYSDVIVIGKMVDNKIIKNTLLFGTEDHNKQVFSNHLKNLESNCLYYVKQFEKIKLQNDKIIYCEKYKMSNFTIYTENNNSIDTIAVFVDTHKNGFYDLISTIYGDIFYNYDTNLYDIPIGEIHHSDTTLKIIIELKNDQHCENIYLSYNYFVPYHINKENYLNVLYS